MIKINEQAYHGYITKDSPTLQFPKDGLVTGIIFRKFKEVDGVKTPSVINTTDPSYQGSKLNTYHDLDKAAEHVAKIVEDRNVTEGEILDFSSQIPSTSGLSYHVSINYSRILN